MSTPGVTDASGTPSPDGVKPKRGRPVTSVTDQAIAIAADGLARRKHKHQIIAEIEAALKHPIGRKQREQILTLGRAVIINRESRDPDEERCQAIALYESIIRDAEADPRDRIKAQERLDRIYGIEAKFGPQERQRLIGQEAQEFGTQIGAIVLKYLPEDQREACLRELEAWLAGWMREHGALPEVKP